MNIKKFNKNSIVIVLVLPLVLGALGLAGPIAVFAATTPSLGTAATFGVLSDTFTTIVGITAITGDLGYTTPPVGGLHSVTGSTYIGGGLGNATYQLAKTAQGTALTNLNAQYTASCTLLGGGGAVNLNNVAGHETGHYTPGCYYSTGAMNITVNQTVTLDGDGTYIFKPIGALTTEANTNIILNGASACDVFWIPTAATTLGAYTGAMPNTISKFAGTIIDDAGINIGNQTDFLGRALAASEHVQVDTNTITVPTCVVATPTPNPSSDVARFGTITVVKRVINDNGGNKTIADFPLFVDSTPVVSGVTNTFPSISGVYSVSETLDSNYAEKFSRMYSGDCDANGQLNLTSGQNKYCIITNDDIGAPVVVPPVPPLIDVIKVPSPLALPAGPGAVAYTYTLKNIGTVAVTNITMVGDTCSPITLISGDTNSDSKLDVNETWVHTCSTTLSATHTNTVVATGWANGISATDIASATVVVGAPTVPPLIHVTKVPSPLALLAGGGTVIYTKKVTNPGTVALSNVRVSDDKCSPLNYISGDTNGDAKLDTTETWTYTCQTNLTKTTTNTATASGDANGLTARDFAIATVVVATAAPALPNTGIAPDGKSILWEITLPVGILILVFVSLIAALRKRIA